MPGIAKPVAEDLLRIDCADQGEANALAEALRSTGGWLEVVAGVDCVVVQFDNAAIDVDEATRRASDAQAGDLPSARADILEIPVCYADAFAPDMGPVCEALGLDRDAVIAAHTRSEHRVRMLGFTPGFAYVDGAGEALSVRRLPEPRAFVEPGSIGLAGGQTGIYAMPGPGGWQLIGRTPLVLFDADRDPPFLLMPGHRVRFRQISEREFEGMRRS